MQITVLGATGSTGRQVVHQALCAGHGVTALVRRPGVLPEHPALRLVVGQLDQRDVVRSAVRGADAVISALGNRGNKPATTCTDGIAAALGAMRTEGVRRLVVVSAHGAAESRDHSLYCLVLWASVGHKLRDKEAMEALLHAADDVEWTIVRPPALGSGPRTGTYRTGTDLRMPLTARVSRADLANFLLHEAASPSWTGCAVRIAA